MLLPESEFLCLPWDNWNFVSTSVVYKKFAVETLVGIDTICFFFQHIMLFIMLFFFAQIMLKSMLFALHYAELF